LAFEISSSEDEVEVSDDAGPINLILKEEQKQIGK